MIRVLHVLGGLHSGGMETMIMNYYRNINREKVQFDFLVSSPKSFYDDEVIKLGGRIHRVSPIRKGIRKNNKEVDCFFKKQKDYDIVHIHQGILNLVAIKKAAKYNVPVRIAHSHGIDRRQLKLLSLYSELYAKPKISKLATEYITCSENVTNHLFIDEIISSKKYRIINNAVDTEKFSFDEKSREKIREQLNLKNKFVIGHVGAFLSVKNHKFIIDVFEEILSLDSNSVLLLVGTGELVDNIKRVVSEKNLKEQVIFLGRRSNVNELMSAMDVFLFPSLFEGLPLSVIEAQTSGLRCFISDTITKDVGITELVKFIGLERGPKYWADLINDSNNNYKREMMNICVKKAGYDIKVKAIELQEFYIDCLSTRSN